MSADARVPRQEFEQRVDTYPPAKRAVLRRHLDRALANLGSERSKLQVAAAINSYVFQHLRIARGAGDGPTVLTRGTGLCGEAVVATVELLRMAGIRARPAALLGIPFQGNHSLVEAYFTHGRAGLLDPTFGVLWYSRKRRRPVPLARLLADPGLSSRTLHKTVFPKRADSSRQAVGIASLASGYRLRRNYAEPGRMDWRRAFAERGGAGLAYTRDPLRMRIHLHPGDRFGVDRWDGTGEPWNNLARAKDRQARFLPWAFALGFNPFGFNVAHSYRVRGLVPGRRYRLRMSVAISDGPRLTLRRAGSRLFSMRLPVYAKVAAGARAPVLEVPFTASASRMRLRLTARGFVRFQALALLP